MSQSLRLIFAGTPDFAAVSLQALIKQGKHEICCVYTQPDRPAGRGKILKSSPVKQLALEHSLPIRQSARLDAAAVAQFADLRSDLMVVVAYGLILPAPLLHIPHLGCINIHASLLPRWRGAAPIERAILAGDTETGITVMRIEPALDSGPILTQRRCVIGEHDTAGDLHDKLAALGASLLLETLPAIAGGRITSIPQDERLATYARKITRSEARLDWHRPASDLALAVRAFTPRPGATATLAGREIKILRARALHAAPGSEPGTVIQAQPRGIDVQTSQGILRLLIVQTPGKRPVTAADYLNAHPEL
jgi:methionyl-tRNA formyltransferase